MARKMGNVRPAGRHRKAKNHKDRDGRQWGGESRRGWLVGRMMLQRDIAGTYAHEWLLIEAPTMADASAMADVIQENRKMEVCTARQKAGMRPPTYFNPAMP